MTDDHRPAAPTTNSRDRILDVALDVLGEHPNAGLGEIAAAAGVVRRTVYAHFPGRPELIQTLTERAADELDTALSEAIASARTPGEAWATYIDRVWPLAHRYQALLVLRRGEHGDDIHARLAPVEQRLTALVARGQDTGDFGRHLPAAVVAQLAQLIVFNLADTARQTTSLDAHAATVTSLLCLGVPLDRAQEITSQEARTGPTSAANSR